MEKDQIFILEDRGVLFITGKDTENFLQNIVTNDITKVSENFSSTLKTTFSKDFVNLSYNSLSV